ncbi:DUF6364 family protein [Petrimonas sp.]|uniref:DUF6364 family protein n=1 Tax=Petrimonas sp. TaxID=2023866 RepID=UPI003F513A0A
MTTKLTLTMDKSVIERAKKYAKREERSLSNLVENYLKALTYEKKDKKEDEELSPIVKSLKGSFKAPKDFDYKKELMKRLEEKYL